MQKFELRYFDGSFNLCKINLLAEIIEQSKERLKIKPLEKSSIIYKVLKSSDVCGVILLKNNIVIFEGNFYPISEEELTIVKNNSFDPAPYYSENIKLIEL